MKHAKALHFMKQVHGTTQARHLADSIFGKSVRTKKERKNFTKRKIKDSIEPGHSKGKNLQLITCIIIQRCIRADMWHL